MSTVRQGNAESTPRVAVRAARKKLRMTQAQLAKALAVSPRTVEGWEIGRRVPGGPAMRLLEQLVAKKNGVKK
jgi:putative transcriptional regulator